MMFEFIDHLFELIIWFALITFLGLPIKPCFCQIYDIFTTYKSYTMFTLTIQIQLLANNDIYFS